MKYRIEKLEKMQEKVRFLRDRDLTNCIFGFASFACCDVGVGEDYGDFSMLLFDDGKLEYKEYLCVEIPKRTRQFYLDTKYVERIAYILRSHFEEIAAFQDTDNNLAFDGSFEHMIFNGRRTESYNIDASRNHTTVKEQCSAESFDQHKKVIAIEKQKLIIFDEISDVLKQAGIILSLNSVEISRFIRLKTMFNH